MAEREIYLLTLAMTAVTVVPRLLPLVLFAERELPRSVRAFLRYVPVSIIAAMLGPQIFLRNARLDLGFDNLYFWIAIPTFAVAWRTKNLCLTALFGMALLAVVRAFVG